jgi:predicted HicB family RNase H-like nuclease
MYPEINYSIPKEVQEKLQDTEKISSQCLTLFIGPPTEMRIALWICSEDLASLIEMKEKISGIIRRNNANGYEFVADYVQGGSKTTPGIVNVGKETINFTDMQNKLLLTEKLKNLELYASTLYLKEDIDWKGDAKKKPDPARCLKVMRTKEVANKNPDIFCIYFVRSDVTLKMRFTPFQARLAAEFYTNKINIRMQNVATEETKNKLREINPKKLEIDAKILFPLKILVRQIYFRVRRHYINEVRIGQMKKMEFASKLECLKKKVVIKVCDDIEICKKALFYCIDKGHLSLRGKRERFTWDLMNPYHKLMGKMNIRINLPKEDSKGKKILNIVTKLKKSFNYYAEKTLETSAGQIPNFFTVRKAFNTMDIMRDKNKTYKNVGQLANFCKPDVKSGMRNIKRKISFLSYAGDNDIFFEYLGFIRDFQFTKG